MSSDGGGGRRGIMNSNRDYVKQILRPSSECFHFFSFYVLQGFEPTGNDFFPQDLIAQSSHASNAAHLSNIKATQR